LKHRNPPLCQHYVETLTEDEIAVQNKWQQVVEEECQDKMRTDGLEWRFWNGAS
jgi:hypothetical protein